LLKRFVGNQVGKKVGVGDLAGNGQQEHILVVMLRIL